MTNRPLAPVSNTEEDTAVVNRADTANKAVANALDAANKANQNYNNIQGLLDSNAVDINNAANYVQTSRTNLRKAADDRTANAGQITVVTTDISNLQSQVDANNGEIANLNAQIKDLENNLQSAGPAVADALKKLEEINNNINAVNNGINDLAGRIDGGNAKIATYQKTISETQAIIDNWPSQEAAAKTAVNNANDRVDRLRRELNDAIADQARFQTAYNDILTLKTTAPRIISENKANIQTVTDGINADKAALKKLTDQLAALNSAKTTTENNINNIKAGTGDLGRKLNDLRGAVKDKQAALTRYQAQWTQATAVLTQLRNNEPTYNANVEDLTTQLNVAENQFASANTVRTDLIRQLSDAERLIQATRVALEQARTEKELADQALRETVQRTGQTLPNAFVPGTGPYAIPGVTGNPASGTVNPYAPGTIFGTGRGTTGSGLPIAAAPGSPYNNLITQGNFAGGSRTISSAQAGNMNPSALYPLGSGAFNAGTPGYVLGRGAGTQGTGGCGAAPSGANVFTGSNTIAETGQGWWALNNGVRVQVQSCAQGAGSCGKGSKVNWAGYRQGSDFHVIRASCGA